MRKLKNDFSNVPTKCSFLRKIVYNFRDRNTLSGRVFVNREKIIINVIVKLLVPLLNSESKIITLILLPR